MTRNEARRVVSIFKKSCPKVTMSRKDETVLAKLFLAAFELGENNNVIMRASPFTVTVEELLATVEDRDAADLEAAANSLTEYKCLGGKTLAEFKKEIGL